MLSQKLEAAFNEQINKEFYSSYLYLSMSAYFEAKALPGFASWMQAQAKEEWEHGMKLFNYVYERGGKVVLQGIDTPPSSFGKPTEVMEAVLAHEQSVTAAINALYDLAKAEKDAAAEIYLQWFVTEQVEEEKTATDLVDQLKMAGDMPFSILFMDKHVLGAR